MAIIKKQLSKVAGTAPAAPSKVLVSLPTQLSVPPDSMLDYTWLVYGAKKIGKTSLVSHFEGALFLSTEPGTKGQRVFSIPCPTWQHFIQAVDLAVADTSGRYNTFVVDTVDNAYEHAWQYICKKKMISHPRDENDFGATFKEIRVLFRDACLKLIQSGKGVVFLSHDTEKEMENAEGETYNRVQPSMAKQALEEIEAVVDVIGHYHYRKDARYLSIQGREALVAGNRLEERFIRKGGKPRVAADRIREIPLGGSSAEAYANIEKAFMNQQETVDPTATAKLAGTVGTPPAVARKLSK